jgi:predicted transcriptional regulator
MASNEDAFRFVASSPVRSNILRHVNTQPRTTAALIQRIDASKSAVYGGLDELEAQEMILMEDDHWTPTGHGQILADIICAGKRYSDFEERLHTYFNNHDVSVLPPEFRLRIGELGGADIMTAPESQPQQIINLVADRLDKATDITVMTRIVIDSYTEAISDTPTTRLLLDRQIIESVDNGGDRYETVEDAEVRIGSVPAPVLITDDSLLLSLPTPDGKYDPQSELVAETENARAWGTQLFESCWNQAVPADELVSER